jgi:hypothetical protein
LQESASNTKNIEKKIELDKVSREIYIHYANKYGGNEAQKLKYIIAHRFLGSLIRLGYEAHNAELVKDIIVDSRKYGVTPSIIDYLYFAGSKDNTFSSIIRYFIPSLLRCKRFIEQLKQKSGVDGWKGSVKTV